MTMKTIITGSKNHDFILNERAKAIKDDKGNLIPSDPEKGDGFVKCRGWVESIEIYLPETAEDEWKATTRFIKVQMTARDIKALHERILEVEQQEFDEFVD